MTYCEKHSRSMPIDECPICVSKERDRLRVDIEFQKNRRADMCDALKHERTACDKLLGERDRMLEGEAPRRFDEWSDDDGDVIWWDTSMTGGEICEPPVYVSSPLCSDWPFDDDDDAHYLYWVPLPRLSANKPAGKALDGKA